MLPQTVLSLLSSLQGLLHSMLGFLVALWVLVLTIAVGVSDPRLVAVYRRVSYFFLIVTAEILVAEVTTALAIAFGNEILANISFIIGIAVLITSGLGFWVLHRFTIT